MQYRIVTEVFVENEDGWTRKEASIGETVDAESFSEALPKFNLALNDQWNKVAEMASMIDAQPESSKTEPEKETDNNITITMPDGRTVQALILPDHLNNNQ